MPKDMPASTRHPTRQCSRTHPTQRTYLVCCAAAVISHVLQQLLQPGNFLKKTDILQLNDALQAVILKASIAEGVRGTLLLLLGLRDDYLLSLCCDVCNQGCSTGGRLPGWVGGVG